MCTVNRGRDAPLVRELLERPHTDVPHLQAMTMRMWTMTPDGTHGTDRWFITQKVTVRDVFVLHRKADFLDLEVRRGAPMAAAASDQGNPPALDWWVECKAAHGGTCAKRWDHDWLMREAEQRKSG